MNRPCYKVSTSCHGGDVAGDTAAALAAGYLAFKDMCGGASENSKCFCNYFSQLILIDRLAGWLIELKTV